MKTDSSPKIELLNYRDGHHIIGLIFKNNYKQELEKAKPVGQTAFHRFLLFGTKSREAYLYGLRLLLL